MSTAEHPSGQWSCVSPWETTLISWTYDLHSVNITFKRGIQSYHAREHIHDYQSLLYAHSTEDETMAKALESLVFHQAMRALGPAISRMQEPNRISHRLSNFYNHMIDPYGISTRHEVSDVNGIVQVPFNNPSGLPLYDWKHFQVLEAFKDGLKVQARVGTIAKTLSNGEVYGCILFRDKQLAADGAYASYLEALDHLRDDVEAGKFDEDETSGYYFVVPRLRGLLRVNEYSTSILGFLFSWIDTWTKAPCLSQLSRDLRTKESVDIYKSCSRLFRIFKRLGYPIVAEGRANEILNMVGITPTGQPFIRLPDLGTFSNTLQPTGTVHDRRQKFSFFTERNDDAAALEKILSFLDSDGSLQSPDGCPQSPDGCLQSAGSPFPANEGLKCLRPEPRNHLEQLPQELLDRILDLLLLRPSIYCTERGFYASPPLNMALFGTSKHLRRSALLRFVRNSFVIEHRFLRTFLYRYVGIKISNPNDLPYTEPIWANADCWASLRDITLIVGIEDHILLSREARSTLASWEKTGRALSELLRRKKGGEADRKTKITLAFLDDPEPVASREQRAFFRTCRHFSEFASIKLRLFADDDWETRYSDVSRLERAYEILEEEIKSERAESELYNPYFR